MTSLQLSSSVRQIHASATGRDVSQIPEPLDRQLAHAARRRSELQHLPLMLGGLGGAVVATLVVWLWTALGIHMSHRVDTALLGILAGFAGPVTVKWAIERWPERFGFEPEDLD